MEKIASYNELISRIRSELTVGEKLLALADEKRKSVIANNLDEIKRLSQEESTTIHELEELGFERQELILELTKIHKLRVTEKLGDLLPQIKDAELQNTLVDCREKLMHLYGRIARATQLNGELLTQSIMVTRQLFGRLSHVDRRNRDSNYKRFQKKAPMGRYAPPTFNHQG
jgi:hypothetical protein